MFQCKHEKRQVKLDARLDVGQITLGLCKFCTLRVGKETKGKDKDKSETTIAPPAKAGSPQTNGRSASIRVDDILFKEKCVHLGGPVLFGGRKKTYKSLTVLSCSHEMYGPDTTSARCESCLGKEISRPSLTEDERVEVHNSLKRDVASVGAKYNLSRPLTDLIKIDTPWEDVRGILLAIGPVPKPYPRQLITYTNLRKALRYIDEVCIQTMTPPREWEVGSRGCVIAGGGRYWATTYVTCRVLRYLGWTYPIEVWHLANEMDDEKRTLLSRIDVQCVDASTIKPQPRILAGWELKAFAVLNSQFNEVLYLDADCYPIRNPDYLFDHPRYKNSGAFFTPDGSRFDLKFEQWEFFGLQYRNEMAFESGQFIVNKEKHWRTVRLALHYCEWSDFNFEVIYGDKDTFHVAARKLGLDYAISPKRPGGGPWGLFQKDLDGNPLFVHRIHAKLALEPTKFISHQNNSTTDSLPLDNYCQAVLGELREAEKKKRAIMALPQDSRLPHWFGFSRGDFEVACRGSASATPLPATKTSSAASLARVLGKYNLFLDPSNNDMMPWLAKDGFWEPWITLALAKTIRPGWHCIDGGACMGYYTVYMADMVGSTGKVLSVEPLESNVELIKRSIAANGYGKWVTVEGSAIYSSAMQVPFNETPGFGGSRIPLEILSTLSQRTMHDEPLVWTVTKTIDSLTQDWPRCDLIKLDIEGAEVDALKGAEETLRKFPKCTIAMEYCKGFDVDGKGVDWLKDRWPKCHIMTHEGGLAPIEWSQVRELENGMLWLQN